MFRPRRNSMGPATACAARQVPDGAGSRLPPTNISTIKPSASPFSVTAASTQGQVMRPSTWRKLWEPAGRLCDWKINKPISMDRERTSAASAENRSCLRPSGIFLRDRRETGRRVMDVLPAASSRRRDETLPALARAMNLEMKTYRYRASSMSDPAKYRSRDEVTKGPGR